MSCLYEIQNLTGLPQITYDYSLRKTIVVYPNESYFVNEKKLKEIEFNFGNKMKVISKMWKSKIENKALDNRNFFENK